MLERSNLWEFALWILRGVGAIVASAIYLGSVVAVGIHANKTLACDAAVMAAGLTFLGYLAQMIAANNPAWWVAARGLTISSILVGALAGVFLLVA